jgi:hypothetical protein
LPIAGILRLFVWMFDTGNRGVDVVEMVPLHNGQDVHLKTVLECE